MKNQKGITIVALAVTVFVTLIIAGISITALTGDNGIINHTTETTKDIFDSSVVDALTSMQVTYTSKKEFLNFLKNKNYVNYVDSEYKIDVKKLLNTKDANYGNGSDQKDIYTLDNQLKLYYYDKDGHKNEIQNLGLTMTD